ncbi:alanine racemase [Planctomycetota bacterium]|nr:alanine racemase [Planctomycetota bacterium]
MESAILEVSRAAIAHNYDAISRAVQGAEVMGVVKADGYGHGAVDVARVLCEAGARMVGVASCDEAVELRVRGGFPPERLQVVVLGGVAGLEEAAACVTWGLTPAIHDLGQFDWLQAVGFTGRFWAKMDTGMSRLGLGDLNALRQVATDTCRLPEYLMSHLACADDRDHPLNREQWSRFVGELELWPEGVGGSLLNSAGVANFSDWGLGVVRPGIAIYGGDRRLNEALGLRRASVLRARVKQVRLVRAGRTVSYGATHQLLRDSKIAVLGIGYADGMPWHLSGVGRVSFGGELCPIVGRVCMDYTMVDVSGTEVEPGDMVEVWGGVDGLDEVAEMAGTIGYELLTRLGTRVRRVHVD